jgi:hypothetical protein
MGLLAWVTMGLALWHFSIFVPDRFWGGIVGNLVCAVTGAVVFALAVNGFTIPNNDNITIFTSLDAIPGALLGMAFAYAMGVRKGNPALEL